MAYCHNSVFPLSTCRLILIGLKFFSMREYIFWHLTLKPFSQLRTFIKKVYISNCQSKAASLLDAVTVEDLFSQSWNLRPNCTCRYRDLLPGYLLECFAQFYFPKVRTMQYFQGKLWACSRQSLLCSLVAGFAFCNFVAVF